jgi:glycosyltransferase involved in cell wall biosynthesis
MLPDDPVILVSMIVATLGRSNEVEYLLASLAALGRRDFEVIVVDQNRDDRLVGLLDGWRHSLRIVHLRTGLTGVCRARNLGASQASGQWLLFPDDDCWYPADLLARFDSLRQQQPADFYCGRAVNAAGETIMGRFSMTPVAILRDNVWTTLIEWMLFVRRDAFAKAGGFDEKIGPGSGTPWGAYEIQDLGLQLLKTGARGYYDPDLTGGHPDDRAAGPSAEGARKMRYYGAGLGYVMRKHGYRFIDYVPHLLRPLAGIVVYMLTGRRALAHRSRQILIGRWSGWRSA